MKVVNYYEVVPIEGEAAGAMAKKKSEVPNCD
jgi:hypothetical protein